MERDRFDRKVDHTVDRKTEFRRFEVITGVGRRRQWPEEVKARIVMESLEDGAVIASVARRHGLRPQQLFDWRRKFRESLPPCRAPEQIAFAPVVVDQLSPAQIETLPSTALAMLPPEFEIAIGSATVRLRGSIDCEALTAVLRAVKASS